MHVRLKQLLALTAVFYLLFICTGNTAYAHKMMIEHVEQGKIQVKFEDGKPAGEAEVELFNEEGEKIDDGTTGEEGYFSYDPELEPSSIVATDRLGHQAEWESGENSGTGEGGLSNSIAAVIIVAALVIVAGVFYLRNNRKPDKG